jgi:ParB/RepB/Spo0J family partition protein
MQLEFHQIAMKYERLRIRTAVMDSRLLTSLSEQGQHNPVLVVSEPSEQRRYVLIDGYRRVEALKRMGRDTVEAVELNLSESAALILWHSQRSGPRRSALSEGWLIRELLELHGITQREVSNRLQKSDSWVSRRLSLVKQLPETVQEQVRRGQISEWAAMKIFVPVARAKRSDCEKMAQALLGQRVSTRQIQQIYAGYKKGDSEQRERIVSHPMLYLKASEEAERSCSEDKQASDEQGALLQDVEILAAVSSRARRRVREMSGSQSLSEPVVLSWQAARSSFFALSKTVKERIDAGS